MMNPMGSCKTVPLWRLLDPVRFHDGLDGFVADLASARIEAQVTAWYSAAAWAVDLNAFSVSGLSLQFTDELWAMKQARIEKN